MSKDEMSEFSVVAVIDGNSISIQKIVASELNKNGIVCYMEGSLGYAVMVPKPLIKTAKKVLLESPAIKPEWLHSPQDPRKPLR